MASSLLGKYQNYSEISYALELLIQNSKRPLTVDAITNVPQFLKGNGYQFTPSQCNDYKMWERYRPLYELLVDYQNGELTTSEFNTKFGKDNLTLFASDVREANRTRQARQEGDLDRNLTTYWIVGKGGIGKTSFTKAYWSKQYSEGNIYVAQNAASRHAMDGYDCHKVVIYDDYKFSSEGGSDCEWFKNNFDPKTATVAAARYCDKSLAHIEQAIITETYAPGELVGNSNWWTEQDKDQFWRRLNFKWYELTEEGLFVHEIPQYQNIGNPKPDQITTSLVLTTEQVLEYVPWQKAHWDKVRESKQHTEVESLFD